MCWIITICVNMDRMLIMVSSRTINYIDRKLFYTASLIHILQLHVHNMVESLRVRFLYGRWSINVTKLVKLKYMEKIYIKVKMVLTIEQHIKRKIGVIVLLVITIAIVTLLGLSKYSFQKACSRREIYWPDLGTADDWQYKILTEGYKIKIESNRKITITASDGVELIGHYYERKKNAPVIIFFHGLRSNSYTNGVPIYRITKKHGWNLLLVSLRAHGESGGNASTLGVLERYDCLDWANWVYSELGMQVPIYLMGISMGGSAVLMSSDLELPKSVCGIIDEAGFTTPLEMIKIGGIKKFHNRILTDMFMQSVNIGTKIWGGFDLKDANACIAVSKTRVPILIIHGDNDTQAPVSMAYRIYDSCKSEKQLYIVSGAEHKDCYKSNPEKYESIVSEFIEKHILDEE